MYYTVCDTYDLVSLPIVVLVVRASDVVKALKNIGLNSEFPLLQVELEESCSSSKTCCLLLLRRLPTKGPYR